MNHARIEIHRYVPGKVKRLWTKGPTDDWTGNIAALERWGYLTADQAQELCELYRVRCEYLHSAPIGDLEADALRMITGLYELLRALIGFPSPLFHIAEGNIVCTNTSDPLVKALYALGLAHEE